MSGLRSLYAIIDQEGAHRLADCKEATDLRDVDFVEHGRLVALLGKPAQSRFFQSQTSTRTQQLRTYLSVLECAMEEAIVLPAAPFSTLPEGEFAAQLLDDNLPMIEQNLIQYGRKLEIQISVRWDVNLVIRQILTQEGLTTHRPEPNKIKVRAARALEDEIACRRSKLTHAIFSAVRPVILDQIIEDKCAPDILCSFKVMLAKEDEQEFYSLLRSISEGTKRQLKISCVGPLPPYSFASLSLVGSSLHVTRNSIAQWQVLETPSCDPESLLQHQPLAPAA